jgi:hypothetical protein
LHRSLPVAAARALAGSAGGALGELDTPGYLHFKAALATSAGSLAFALNQNRGGVIGGPIHWSKAAWLNLTIMSFVVLPAVWWRCSGAGREVRRALGMMSLLFVLRGVAELHLIYVSKRWKCGYGITHDFAALLAMAGMLLRWRTSLVSERDREAVAFSIFVIALLGVEARFAKMFRSVQDPATGIYFADDSPKFRKVIRATKTVVFIAYPVLLLIMWRARREFGPGRGRTLLR